MSSDSPQGLSFRDPAGRVVQVDGRIFRIVKRDGIRNVKTFFESAAVNKCVSEGSIIKTWKASPADLSRALAGTEFSNAEIERSESTLEHERVLFPSFPYEWPPEMLHAAGSLTLDLCDRLLVEGICLKDATPYNILFRGTRPVFVDVLSVEPREPHDPIWLPYAQFMTCFVLPLLANKRFGLSLDNVFLSRRDGIEPEELYGFCGKLGRFIPSNFVEIVLPTWLGRLPQSDVPTVYRKRVTQDASQAAYMLQRLFAKLRRKLNSVAPREDTKSKWSEYEQQNSYSADDGSRKREFVDEVLKRTTPAMVLDIGCNTGFFSGLAARRGASVVAIDSDPVVVGRTFRSAQRDSLDIQALMVDVSRPTPAVGWANSECPSFLERAEGRFDAVFMLAVAHHLAVTERIPLRNIVDLLSRLTKDIALVEYVSREDPMFRKLARGRDALYEDLTEKKFVAECLQRFSVAEKVVISNTRNLYLLKRSNS